MYIMLYEVFYIGVIGGEFLVNNELLSYLFFFKDFLNIKISLHFLVKNSASVRKFEINFDICLHKLFH